MKIPHTWSFSASLTISVKIFPSQLKPLFNTTNIIFFVGFPVLSYLIQQHATRIEYTKPYGKPNQLDLLSNRIQIIIPYGLNTLSIKKLSLKILYSFKFRHHG